jgi:hypothetical protein
MQHSSYSVSPVARVASEYYANVCKLMDKRCTPEQHRAENRRLKSLVSEAQWTQAKAIAIAKLAR